MLARVVGSCWHALVRDVISLGYRKEDIFRDLDLVDMVSIVIASPPGSSIRYYLDGGWTRTDHLLANMQEGSAGIAELSERYERPGVVKEPQKEEKEESLPSAFGGGDALTWEEFDIREAERYARAAKLAEQGITPTNTTVRTL